MTIIVFPNLQKTFWVYFLGLGNLTSKNPHYINLKESNNVNFKNSKSGKFIRALQTYLTWFQVGFSPYGTYFPAPSPPYAFDIKEFSCQEVSCSEVNFLAL